MAPVVRRTWAPIGKTPILYQRTRSHKKLTVIGALCTTSQAKNPRLYFRMYENQNMNGKGCCDFLKQLSQNIKGHVIVLWDGLKAHWGREVRNYLKQHSKVECYAFPPYAPELNPIEYMWGYLKMNPLSNFAPETLDELSMTAKASICETRKNGHLLKSFLAKCPLPFFD